MWRRFCCNCCRLLWEKSKGLCKISSMPKDRTGGGTKGLVGTFGMERFNAHGWGTMFGWLADDKISRFCRPYSQVGEICGAGGVVLLVVMETGEAVLPVSSSFSMSIFSSSSSSKDLSSTSRSSKSVEESRSGEDPWYCSSLEPSVLWLFNLQIYGTKPCELNCYKWSSRKV